MNIIIKDSKQVKITNALKLNKLLEQIIGGTMKCLSSGGLYPTTDYSTIMVL